VIHYLIVEKNIKMDLSSLTIQWILNALSIFDKLTSTLSSIFKRLFVSLVICTSLFSCTESLDLDGGDLLRAIISYEYTPQPLDKVYKDKVFFGEWEALYEAGQPNYVAAVSKVMVFQDLALVHVYFHSSKVKIIAFDKRTGHRKWEYALPPSMRRPSYIDQKDNYIISVDENSIICFDIIARAIKWQQPLKTNYFDADIHPLLIDDHLYIGQIDNQGYNKMVSYNLNSGIQEIVFTESKKWKSNEFSKPCIVTNGDKYLIFKSRFCNNYCEKTEEDLRVYNLSKKTMHWEIDKLNNASTSFDNIIYNDNNSIYTVGNRDLFQIDVIDKEIKNKIPVFDPNLKYYSKCDSHFDLEKKVMYIHTIEDNLLAINTEDMTIKWKISNIRDSRCLEDTPCIINDKLFINDHGVNVLDKNTGKPINIEYVWNSNSLDGKIVYDAETGLFFGNNHMSITAFRYTK
jgi:outer membrane protein assembly factor BamB